MKSTSKQRLTRLDSGTWRSLLKAQASSGLSIKAFCAERDLKEASVYSWRKRLSLQEANGMVQFSPISIERPAFGGDIRLTLPGGLVLNFSDLPPVDYLRAMSLEFSGL